MEKEKQYLKELQDIKVRQLKGHRKAIEMIEKVYKDKNKMDDESKRIYGKAVKEVKQLTEDIEELEKLI